MNTSVLIEKQYFAIYNSRNDRFLLDKTSPDHRPYTWVEGMSGIDIMGIRKDMLDDFISGKHETAFHILKFLKSTCPHDDIMIIPMNMTGKKRGTFDFTRGFKLL